MNATHNVAYGLLVRLGIGLCLFTSGFSKMLNAQEFKRRPEMLERIEAWQSMRDELCSAIAPLRQPEFEIRLLARGKDSLHVKLAELQEFVTLPIHDAEWADIGKPQTQQLLQKIASILSGP